MSIILIWQKNRAYNIILIFSKIIFMMLVVIKVLFGFLVVKEILTIKGVRW